jgi:hypothetical protein
MMNLNSSAMASGMTPSSLGVPIIVCVFPDAV